MRQISFSKKKPELPVVTEAQHQRAYMQWARMMDIHQYIMVSVSGVPLPLKTAMNLKSQGWSAGIPDWFVAIPRDPYHGLFIELKKLKSDKPKIRPEQTAFLNRLTANGYAAAIAYGWEHAKEITVNYLELNSEKSKRVLLP